MLEHLKRLGLDSLDSDQDLFNKALNRYCDHPLFAQGNELIVADNPFRRPIKNDFFSGIDLSKPIEIDSLNSNESLIANRILMSIYERDFVFLPKERLKSKWRDFQAYYSQELRFLGDILKPYLENYLFSWIHKKVMVTGDWDSSSFAEYFEHFKANLRAEGNAALMRTIVEAQDKVGAAKVYYSQMAADFLVESSAMARHVPGNYGRAQSELSKVVIDEIGYGVHETKHSTLFQNVLEHHGMESGAHALWLLFSPYTLFLNNYYNYICSNHQHVFRYFGAILQVETSFSLTCQQMADMSSNVFGPGTELEYFLEHVHIDDHHSRMVLEKVIQSVIEQHGNVVISEIVQGFEESLLIGDAFGNGLNSLISYVDRKIAAPELQSHCRSDSGNVLEIPPHHFSGSAIANSSVSIGVDSGSLNLMLGYQRSLAIPEGSVVSIPKGTFFAIHAGASGAKFSYQQQELDV